MFEFLQAGATAASKGIFIPVPNLPNSFTEDYVTTQTTAYKNGRFILSFLTKASQTITATDFLNNPNETNKLGISISTTPLRVDNNTEDRILSITFIKVLNTITGQMLSPDIGEPLDDTFPTGLFQIDDIFPLAQLLNVGEQVSYSGVIISESALLSNGLASLTLNSDGLAFVEAFLKGIFKTIPSQSGGISSVILPYTRPRVTVNPSPFNAVAGLFDGVDSVVTNLYNVFLTVTYSISIRMAVNPDRTTVSIT